MAIITFFDDVESAEAITYESHQKKTMGYRTLPHTTNLPHRQLQVILMILCIVNSTRPRRWTCSSSEVCGADFSEGVECIDTAVVGYLRDVP